MEVQLKVDGVSKDFKLPHERHSSLKQTVLNLRKRQIDKLHILKNISFEVKQGEFFGIVGRNGSGKSTLLKLIAGIYQPSKGSITVNGKLTPFIELGVGFNMELSGKDNIFLNGAILGLTKKEITSKYEDIVAFAELEKFMDQKLKNYSSGMLVRLAFSIAIQAHADILLVDEVLAVGDANFQRKCFDIFDKIKKEGKTVIFVTHDMSSVQRFCDRGLVLDKGEIKLIGTPTEVADAYQEVNLQDVIEQDRAVPRKYQKTNIEVKIIQHDHKKRKLRFRLVYKNDDMHNVYLGFSIVKDGATVAELNNLDQHTTATKGQIEYELDTKTLNPGYYEIAAGIISYDSRQLIRATVERARFNILGHDPMRGGALHLPTSWQKK